MTSFSIILVYCYSS